MAFVAVVVQLENKQQQATMSLNKKTLKLYAVNYEHY